MARCWLCITLLVTLGCAGLSNGSRVDLQAERQALMDADGAWFESHENVVEFVTFLADDAVFMPDGAPAARGDSIRTSWEQLLAMPGFAVEWRATGARVAEAGDLGYTIGTYELTVEQDGLPVVTVGKYVTLWEKQADGSWKVIVDIFNPDGPPAGA